MWGTSRSSTLQHGLRRSAAWHLVRRPRRFSGSYRDCARGPLGKQRTSVGGRQNKQSRAVFLSAKERPFDAFGCVAARESISRPIPCSGPKRGINSLRGRKNSLLARLGSISQIAEFADVFETDFRKNRLIRRNSLRFSLRPGNLARQETGEAIAPESPSRRRRWRAEIGFAPRGRRPISASN